MFVLMRKFGLNSTEYFLRKKKLAREDEYIAVTVGSEITAKKYTTFVRAENAAIKLKVECGEVFEVIETKFK
ncbi:hypothetical protein [Paenibacillus sp. LK1]|uniref:hypothetical protein n=1 Tax=Paenibacillus sp. LK1 TaxID=2053014 RepID=UPI000C1800CC|nr:hypothetical protein [Paenibacillus sp. LK1]PIH59064.1 hypothetical protein CS562_14065 [Paenibacillus sp. LK1]